MRAVLWKALNNWIDHGAATRSAAIAFYTLTSMAPVSVLLVWIGSVAWERETVRRQLITRLTGAVGADTAALVESVLTDATLPGGGALLPTTIAIVIFVFSATAVFGQLQAALRDTWEISEPQGNLVTGFLWQRLVTLGLISVLGLVLAVSTAVRVAVTALAAQLPGALLAGIADLVVSTVTLIGLFTLVFRILPAADVTWREASLGGLVTGVLVIVGQWATAIYLGRTGIASVYGAAASLVVFLSWVYYSSLVFLFGAEVTRELAPDRELEASEA